MAVSTDLKEVDDDCSICGHDMIEELRQPNFVRNYHSTFATHVKISFWLNLTILMQTYLFDMSCRAVC